MAKTKVLAIDDSTASHAYISCILTPDNWDVVHAYDGAQGIQEFQNAQGGFDIILLDWEMPGMQGPDVAAEMRKLGCNRPILMVTSRNKPSDIAEALGKGVSDFMMKPYTVDIIMAKIETLRNAG